MDFKTFFTPENITALATNLALVVFTLISGFSVFIREFKKLKEKESHNISANLKEQSVADKYISRKLEDLKEILGADRVQIYDFHNGIHYANGRSALRITCTYEACRYSIESYQNQLASLPISCLPNFISDLLEDGEFECDDIEKIKMSHPATYSFKKRMQITSFYDIVFHNDRGEIIGFLAIQFCDGKPLNIDKEEIAKTIGYIEAELVSLLSKQENK